MQAELVFFAEGIARCWAIIDCGYKWRCWFIGITAGDLEVLAR